MRFLMLVASLLVAVVAPAFADAASEYQAGQTAYDQNNYAEAIRHYSNAIKLKPDSRAYVARGNAYDDNGQIDLGIADYTAAIAMSPKYPDAYSNRGVAYYRKKEYDRALGDLGKAIELKPDSAFSYVTRGNVYDDKGLPDQALADYSMAMQILRPRSIFFYLLLQSRQGQHLRMFFVAPINVKTFVVLSRLPLGSVFVLDQIRKEHPSQYCLCVRSGICRLL